MSFPTFPTALLSFDDQEVGIERPTISGGASGSGAEGVIPIDGRGRVFADFANGPIMDRQAMLAWRALAARFDDNLFLAVVPFCDPEHQPYRTDHVVAHEDGDPYDGDPDYTGGGPLVEVVDAAPFGATALSLSITTELPLVGGEWFAIEHPNEGWRAYRAHSILPQGDNAVIVQFRPALREAVGIGEVADFRTPRCLMRVVGKMSTRMHLGRYSEAAVRFVEAPRLTLPPAVYPIDRFFTGSIAGCWYDPSDLATMFQDTAGTVPAVIGQPVARIDDKSGNNNHAVQATAAAQPILRQEGAYFYLEFDGVDDRLAVAFDIGQPWTRVSAIRSITWTSGKRLFGTPTGLSGLLRQLGSSPALNIYSGATGPSVTTADVGEDVVVAEVHHGAFSQLGVNSEAAEFGNAGTTATGGLVLASNFAPANFRLYGAVMIGLAMTTTQLGLARHALAIKAGIPDV